MADRKGENEIINKLTDSSGDEASQTVFDAGIFPRLEEQADAVVRKVVYKRGDSKRKRAAREDIPCAAEGVVERGVDNSFAALDEGFAPRAGDAAADEEQQAEREIEKKREH